MSKSEKRNNKQRVDANFTELLQEFRVAQQGVQVLFAFLLTVPFSARFDILNTYQKWVFAAALLSAAFSAVLFIAPVSHHRMLFHQGLKEAIVDYASTLGQVALLFMIVSMLTSVFLIADVVFNSLIAIVFTVVGMAFSTVLWYLVPIRLRKLHD